MPRNPPEGMPRVVPCLFYDDVAAALKWLERAFGFGTRFTSAGPNGQIVHAEVQLEDGVVMVGPASAQAHTHSPRSLPGVSQSLYVYVDDVDAHCRRARAAGAQIVSEPVDKFYGDRVYAARDPEGHHWAFGQHVRDVALDEGAG